MFSRNFPFHFMLFSFLLPSSPGDKHTSLYDHVCLWLESNLKSRIAGLKGRHILYLKYFLAVFHYVILPLICITEKS